MPESNNTSKQHPVPQNVLNVEFKLIGELTIKQFGYIAVGVVLAFITYKSGLYFIWRWFLIFIFVGLSVGMAFVPIQDRGLDIWVKSFVKALFSPTIMLWRKRPQKPGFLQTMDTFLAEAPSLQEDTSRLAKKVELTDILGRIEDADDDPLEKRRRDFILGLDFSAGEEKGPVPGNPPSLSPAAEPSSMSLAPPPSPKQSPPFLQYELVDKKTSQERVTHKIPLERAKKEKGLSKPKPRREREIKREASVKTERHTTPRKGKEKKKARPVSKEAANVVHGIILDKGGKLLEGAVVLIKDQDGDPVRALKSNSLGRFLITTPLDDGDYAIEVRKDGARFDTIKLSLSGTRLDPLTIRAK